MLLCVVVDASQLFYGAGVYDGGCCSVFQGDAAWCSVVQCGAV